MMKRLLITALFGGVCLSAAMAAEQSAAPVPAQGAAKTGTPAPRAARIPDTLMFSIDEYNDIQSRFSRGGDDESSDKAGALPENVSLYLSTIVYYGPKDWTIWINGKPIGPDQDFEAFKITQISPSYVELLVPLSAQGMSPVRLGPNQTFVAKSGVVVEGQQK